MSMMGKPKITFKIYEAVQEKNPELCKTCHYLDKHSAEETHDYYEDCGFEQWDRWFMEDDFDPEWMKRMNCLSCLCVYSKPLYEYQKEHLSKYEVQEIDETISHLERMKKRLMGRT